MAKGETVTISLERYTKLLNDEQYTQCLQGGGVDNWEWHGDSLESYKEITEEQAREIATKEDCPE